MPILKYVRSSIETSPGALVTINSEGKITDFSESAVGVMGVQRENLAGTNFFQYFTDPERAKAVCRQVFEKGSISGYSLTIKHKSGQETDVIYNAIIYKGEKGGVLAVFTAQGITERWPVEKMLRVLSDRQQALLASIPDIIMEVDKNKTYTWANKAGIEFFGGDVYGNPADFYFEGKQDVYDVVQPLFKGSEDVIYLESWQRRKDGEKRLLAWWCRSLKDDNGNVTGAISSARDITDRKRADEELRETSQYLENLISYANAPIMVWDPELRITRFNHAFERLTGLETKDVIGKKIELLFPKETYAQSMAHIKQTTSGEKWETVELPILRRSGEVRTVLWNSATLYAADGKTVISTIAQGQDITERKQAEETLKNSEAFLNSLIDQSAISVWISDDKGILIRLNRACCDLFNTNAKEVVGIYNLFTDNAIKEQGHLEKVESVFKQGKTVHFNIKYDTSLLKNVNVKTPKKIITDVTIFPIKNENGKVTNAVVSHLDVTERKLMENALHESEEKYRDLVERATDGIIIIQDDIIKYANPRMADMDGSTVEHIMGTSFIDHHIAPDEIPKIREKYRQRMEGKIQTFAYETVLRRSDGMFAPAEINGDLISYNGQPADMVIIRDITQRKRAEELLKFRTKELEDVNNELESFVTIAAHDLKEPLRGMQLFSQFLTEDYSDKLDEAGRDYLKRIETGARRSGELIDDLLALSRIARIKNPYSVVDSLKLIKKVIGRLEPFIDQKNVKIELAEKFPVVFCDDVKIKEVFYNIISNGIIYNDGQNPEIKIEAEETEDKVQFSVQDNGIGIKKEYFEDIFKMFRRLHSQQKYGGGTGAGLAIVKKIIEEHKGKVWVESEEGKGSVFFFTIPKLKEET